MKKATDNYNQASQRATNSTDAFSVIMRKGAEHIAKFGGVATYTTTTSGGVDINNLDGSTS